MVILVIFAVKPAIWVILLIVSLTALAMFLPLKFVHPVRTKRWRALTLPVALLWVFSAAVAAWKNFDINNVIYWGLIITSAYLMGAGILQQLTEPKQ